MLHEWFSILATRRTNFQTREVVEWSAQLICKLVAVSKPISRAVDFCVNNILQGYINNFVVEMITSYSEDEINFFQGP